MNELQLGLIGLGACAVAAIFAYNKWQELRYRRQLERTMPRAHADALLDDEADPPAVDVPPVFADERAEPSVDERREPVLGIAAEAPPDDSASPDEAMTDTAPPKAAVPVAPPIPETAARSRAGEAAEAPVGEEAPTHLLSPAIDYIAAFELVEPVAGEQILAGKPLAEVSKPVAYVGFDEESGQWTPVVADAAYRRLRVGLQLADRRGPLGEADLIAFQRAMLALADELLAVADMPPSEPALEAAISLDRFCADLDIQIGINVVGRTQSFPGTKIRALAEAAGMALDGGRFVRCDDEGRALYALASLEEAGFSADSMKHMSTHGLVFLLDVPRVANGDRVFAQMLDLARRMAETLDGVLVDDNRRPLAENMLDPFRRQISQYQAQLAAKGLPAGGPLALRLFA